jgi:hypothetical protein
MEEKGSPDLLHCFQHMDYWIADSLARIQTWKHVGEGCRFMEALRRTGSAILHAGACDMGAINSSLAVNDINYLN